MFDEKHILYFNFNFNFDFGVYINQPTLSLILGVLYFMKMLYSVPEFRDILFYFN